MVTSSRRQQVLSSIFRLTPYFEAAESAGCLRYDVFSHTYAATGDFGTDPLDDYRELTTNVVLMDVACERQIAIEGKDAGALTDYLVTRDITKLNNNQLCYGFCCTDDGFVITDAVIHRVSDSLYWLSPTDTDLALWARGIAHGGRYDVRIYEPDVAPLQIQGPNSKVVMRKFLGNDIDALGFFRSMPATIADAPVIVSRTGWTGELGYEVFPLGSDRAVEIWNAILAAGSIFGMRPIAWSYVRAMESGILAFPYGVIDDLLPLEHWRNNLVALDKGSFIGKKALMKIARSGGPPRKMLGLVGGAAPLPPMEFEWSVCKDSQRIGFSRWSGFSPALQRSIAIGLLRRDAAAPGDAVQLVHPGGREEMTVVELPFVDTEGKPRPAVVAGRGGQAGASE